MLQRRTLAFKEKNLVLQEERPALQRGSSSAIRRSNPSATRRRISPGKHLLSVFSFSITLFCICRKDDNQHQDVEHGNMESCSLLKKIQSGRVH